MLQVGQEAPQFALPGTVGDQIQEHTLTEFTEHGWAVVLVFYPFDFHPSCTSQLCLLRDAEDLSLSENTVVLGFSTDSVHSHQAFAQQNRIDFPLLSDSDGTVCEAYDVLLDELEGHCRVARSALFVVGPDKQVQYAWQSETPSDKPDLEAVAKATNCHGDRCELPERKFDLFET
jgi:peroxiredoxin